MEKIVKDKEAAIGQEVYAVIYSPRKKGRQRYPENCVNIMPDLDTALARADANRHLYPAKIYGPSKSSEGLKMYYLLEWLG